MTPLHAALLPFARYHQRLTDGRRNYPKSGPLYAFDEGCPTETILTVEHFAAAAKAVQVPQWSPRVQAAYAFARERHEGEFRHDGVTPYITHIDAVMARSDPSREVDLIVEALHDLIENKRATLDEIEAQPFSDFEVIDGVVTLTRKPNEIYKDYTLRIKHHAYLSPQQPDSPQEGRWVQAKVNDILANLSEGSGPSRSLILRYTSALAILLS